LYIFRIVARARGKIPANQLERLSKMRRAVARGSTADFLTKLRPGAGLERLFDHLPDVPVWIKDHAGVFRACNRALVTLVGARSEAQVLGRTDRAFFPAHLCEAFARDDRAVLDTGLPIIDRIEAVRGADGKLSWRNTTKIPVLGRDGRVAGVAGVTRAIRPIDAPDARFPGLASVVRTMTERYDEPLTVPALLAGLSVSQFERRFRARFGVAPLRYLTEVRLDAARQLLATTSLPIIDVALRTGFGDQSHFTHRFTRAVGLAPGRYRRAFGTQPR
jgi:PAS domain S-box-containing protein